MLQGRLARLPACVAPSDSSGVRRATWGLAHATGHAERLHPRCVRRNRPVGERTNRVTPVPARPASCRPRDARSTGQTGIVHSDAGAVGGANGHLVAILAIGLLAIAFAGGGWFAMRRLRARS
jgi:hypothetical protein